jgi:hypothetical protein
MCGGRLFIGKASRLLREKVFFPHEEKVSLLLCIVHITHSGGKNLHRYPDVKLPLQSTSINYTTNTYILFVRETSFFLIFVMISVFNV